MPTTPTLDLSADITVRTTRCDVLIGTTTVGTIESDADGDLFMELSHSGHEWEGPVPSFKSAKKFAGRFFTKALGKSKAAK